MRPSKVIAANVTMGEGCVVEDFVILGAAPRGAEPGELPLSMGQDCVIRSHAVIYAGNRIGDRFHAGHGAFLREENRVGDDVSVGTKTVIEHHVIIGHRVRIHSQAFVPEYTVIEDDCWLGPNVVITNARYPASERAKETLAGVRILQGAKVGANATLLPGIEVGAGALVGAGAVVTKDVPAGAVVAGNPAAVVKSVADLQNSDGSPVYQ